MPFLSSWSRSSIWKSRFQTVGRVHLFGKAISKQLVAFIYLEKPFPNSWSRFQTIRVYVPGTYRWNRMVKPKPAMPHQLQMLSGATDAINDPSSNEMPAIRLTTE